MKIVLSAQLSLLAKKDKSINLKLDSNFINKQIYKKNTKCRTFMNFSITLQLKIQMIPLEKYDGLQTWIWKMPITNSP